jgi:hypothetical protein
MVGDRGMITAARIDALRRLDDPIGWVTALRAPAIKKLAADGGPLQMTLFDQQDLAEISHPDHPGERLVACRNPVLAADRARTRDSLLAATEKLPASLEAGLPGRVATLGGRPLAVGRKFHGVDGPPTAGQPLALRSGPASTRRERGAGQHRRASWQDGPGRPPVATPGLSAGLTSGCAGTRRSAAGTKESSDCRSRRCGSRSPGG